ncbi:LPXTG-site transpeptidase (sortase) family protein [Lachnospiraceae bacterium XBB1006]|nr:LPXTG-site transpeptidase (sortase) family protein [Lachnospiraceae bacterium XBB1006]
MKKLKVIKGVVGCLLVVALIFFAREAYRAYIEYQDFQNPPNVESDDFKDLPLIGMEEDEWPEDQLFLTKERKAFKDKDMRLVIPRIDCDEYVMDGTGLEQLRQGPGLYACSQLPGEGNRNVSIAAHRAGVSHYANLFKYIHKIKKGDKIYLIYKKRLFTYRYKETLIVKPEDVSVLYLQGYSCVTLTSCNPLGQNYERIVVRGKLIDWKPVPKKLDF